MEKIITRAREVVDQMPEGILLRNSQYYELLTYVNHSIAFCVYERYDELIVFLIRGIKLCNKKKVIESKNFVPACFEFFEYALSVLNDEGKVSNKSREYIEHTMS